MKRGNLGKRHRGRLLWRPREKTATSKLRRAASEETTPASRTQRCISVEATDCATLSQQPRANWHSTASTFWMALQGDTQQGPQGAPGQGEVHLRENSHDCRATGLQWEWAVCQAWVQDCPGLDWGWEGSSPGLSPTPDLRRVSPAEGEAQTPHRKSMSGLPRSRVMKERNCRCVRTLPPDRGVGQRQTSHEVAASGKVDYKPAWGPSPHCELFPLAPRRPGGASGKEPACQCRRWSLGLIPGSGRSPGGGYGNPLQYSCLENPMDRGAWRGTVHGAAKSQTRMSD